MKNWTVQQFDLIVSQWDDAIGKYYPEHLESWRNPDLHFKHINEVWNLFDAIKIVNWDSIFTNPNTKVLELGAGTGWLSAYLSRFENVDKIYALDSSKNFLNNMFPAIIDRMGGVKDKIEPIEGLFAPIMFDDETLDVIVASSALHHAENLEGVLSEINRVLKRGGTLVVLNETPASYLKFVYLTTKHFAFILKDIFFKNYTNNSRFISSTCILYDQYLGDKLYPQWYWEKALVKAQFEDVNIIDTNMFSTKTANTGFHLKHFVSKKRM